MSEMQVPPPPERAKKIYPPEIEVVERVEVDNPITADCYGCDEELTTDRTNTFYFRYNKQPWFDHVRLVCEQGHCSLVFHDEEPPTGFIEFAEQFMMAEADFCDEEPAFFAARREGLGIEELQERELSVRELGQVCFNTYLFSTLTDEQIQEELRQT